MISVTVGSNTKRNTIIVSETSTPKETFNQEGIDFSTAIVYMDGSTVSPGDLGSTYEDLGITESCTLIAVVKLDNA